MTSPKKSARSLNEAPGFKRLETALGALEAMLLSKPATTAIPVQKVVDEGVTKPASQEKE